MADLSEKNASQTVKIVGADPSLGTEDNFVTVDSSGSMQTVLYDPNNTVFSTIKPANTGAITTDKALVVAVSPNNNIFVEGAQPTPTNAAITGSTTVIGPVIVTKYSTVTVTVTGVTAPISFVFEGSDDAIGTNWFPVYALRNDTGTIENGPLLMPASTNRSWTLNVTGFMSFRVRTTAWTSGSPTVNIAPQAMSDTPFVATTVSNFKPTYSTSSAAFTPPATPTDLFIINGSATKTIKIQKIELSATQTTAGINTFFLAKRSTANTSGTSTTLTKVAHDSAFSAATAVALNYTANPTTGSLVGNIRTSRVLCPAPASVAQPIYIWNFEDGISGVPIVLRGVAEGLALNFGGAALPTGLSVAVSCTWTEE